ncbi:hypothetical protein B9G54_06795 [Alloscardovia macacae]|uniref:alpha/beta hydrolase n=1 Tax=Alloscardovia macacae TaxID=1160091 RepID=UPI000A2EC5D2|nr:alpha/beta hydrolase [Alloscardovia macacae]OTA25859.1 hypothetical protein B9G54_06795 [Alloscardovia macacae]
MTAPHPAGYSDNTSPDAIVAQVRACATPEEAGKFWTLMEEDLDGVSEKARAAALAMRTEACHVDFPRISAWQLPADVRGELAVPYVEDGDRCHYLDVFYPADALESDASESDVLKSDVLEAGARTYPVVIDCHGGGFVYGTRELNRSFAMHLAHRGYVVVLPSYRPGPRFTFADILTDLSAAYSWTRENATRFGGDVNRLFLTGDSAGGCMALYSAVLEASSAFSAQSGIPQAGLDIRGLLLVCGVYDLASCFDETATRGVLAGISAEVFASVREKFAGFESTAQLLDAVSLPPIFVNTASDDFLHNENVDLYERLQAQGVYTELDDADAKKWGSLGHVYVVGLATHERAQKTLDAMDAFIQKVLG